MATGQDLHEQLPAAVERRYRRYCLLLIIVCVSLAAIIAFLAWRQPQPTTVTSLSEEQARTPAGVQLAAEQALVPLSRQQSRDAAAKIEQAADRRPDRVMAVTGKEVANTVESVRKDTKADFALITDPRKPQEKPSVKTAEPVNLQVYNIKAYPGRMVEVSAGLQGADIAYLRRVNVPNIPVFLPRGMVAYAGPFVRMEYGGGKFDGGIRLVCTF